ncbi:MULTISPECIES: patatin-like phospholipase family protein [unclassified Pseudoalteromonas]|uniref:patatin-like phospholipase family protein n=1 Tax=unclassified Pseudoalteromonas TaxID=194690 RepID=UPI0005A76066|nr:MULTISPECIES: patatin-like phospholipase family protein [unclassified Pseudoalteromonas]
MIKKATKHNIVPANKTALLLTGGGARAAYQVGVLKAIATKLPRNCPSPFGIINGTSAGAINATALASYASCFHLGVKKLEWVWKNFSTNQVYHSDLRHVFCHLFSNILGSFQSDHLNHSPASLLDNQPLRAYLKSVMELKRIDKNIANGYLRALSVTASSYTSGESVAFYQAKNTVPWKRAKRCGEQSQINIEHLMASSAIPMVFPSIKINQAYFGDGSIHQLSPLSPPIHLGANKIFIIGVDQPKDNKYLGFQPHYPGISSIAGHLLDTIFSDTLHSDIERLERVNRTVSLLPAKDKHQELKRVETFVINPSKNFNAIACEHYDRMPFAIKMILRLIGVKAHSESSLTSYLLFEKSYTRHLIEIGYEDGLNQIDEILEFLDIKCD